MGIHGIYKEIGPGQRIALSKVAVEHFEKNGRPLRIAIDISIWLFQIQSSKGGTNPALRTFYYRLLRLISLSIHPLFVFDGPNKPPFKRNKRTGPNVASIPEFLAKQLLKQFGLPFHLAPGEAEAECALLQREGVVDAVLSEDVDTLMFGSGLTFRSWSPEASKSKVPTHINLYDASVTKETSGMDREGMILVALMSGGDYVPEGIPGCGPKTACEAARAGFGVKLCQISRRDKDALRAWKDELAHELHTNEKKLFNRKHGKLDIPDDFPNPEVLGYYTHPVISSLDKVEKVRRELKWDHDIDFRELRSFTGDAFDWTKLGGAKKFIRNLAPALLVRELRMRGEALAKRPQTEATEDISLITSIHGKRNHVSTDSITEFRVTFTPHELVPIDLDAEEPDDELDQDSCDEDDPPVAETEAPGSPSKKRAPSSYDPTQTEKLWVFETYVRAGDPSTVQEWEDRAKNARVLVETRNANREAKRAEREKKNATASEAQTSTLERFAKVTKPGKSSAAPKSSQLPKSSQPARSSQPSGTIQKFTRVTKPGVSSTVTPKSPQPHPPGKQMHRWKGNGRLEVFWSPEPEPGPVLSQSEVINLLSLPQTGQPTPKNNQQPQPTVLSDVPDLLLPTVTKRRRSPLRRWQTDPTALSTAGTPNRSCREQPFPASPCSSPLPSPSQLLPIAKKAKVPKAVTPKRGKANGTVPEAIVLFSSSPGRQTNLYDYFTPRRRAAQRRQQVEALQHCEPEVPILEEIEVDSLDLTASSPTRKPSQRSSPRLVNSGRLRDRESTPPEAPVVLPESGELGSIYLNGMSTFRIPPQQYPPIAMFTKPSPSLDVATLPAKKKVYRIRESLPGTFAIEEEDILDLSNDIGTQRIRIPALGEAKQKRRKEGQRFRASEVSILDLTGD